MDETRTAAVTLAALELLPGEPADLTALLRSAPARQALFDLVEPDSACGNHAVDLVVYLASSISLARVEHWADVVDAGARECRHLPLVAGDVGYPRRLNDVSDAPPILFRSINTEWPNSAQPEVDPPGRALAIIGSREVTDDVLEATRTVTARAVEAGYRIVSGLAAGVDTAAHQAALEAGGTTTAVLGTGIDHVFPAENRDLAADITRHGVLVSQFAPPAPRTSTTFLRRNAVIAALSDASLIMDGREHSGSRNEIEHALRYGRRVLMWLPALKDEAWAQQLAESGRGTFVGSPEAVAAALA